MVGVVGVVPDGRELRGREQEEEEEKEEGFVEVVILLLWFYAVISSRQVVVMSSIVAVVVGGGCDDATDAGATRRYLALCCRVVSCRVLLAVVLPGIKTEPVIVGRRRRRRRRSSCRRSAASCRQRQIAKGDQSTRTRRRCHQLAFSKSKGTKQAEQRWRHVFRPTTVRNQREVEGVMTNEKGADVCM